MTTPSFLSLNVRSPFYCSLKFIYCEKATNSCEISTADLFYVVTVTSTVEISQTFVAFSEYMNFRLLILCLIKRKSQWKNSDNVLMHVQPNFPHKQTFNNGLHAKSGNARKQTWLDIKERSQPTKSFLLCETFIWKYILPFLASSVQGSENKQKDLG